MSQWLEILLAIGGGCTAVAAILSLLSRFMPLFRISSRVKKNEGHISKVEEKQTELVSHIENMRNESRIADRLLVRAMVEIVDNRISGNNADGLRSTKKELMEFLQSN